MVNNHKLYATAGTIGCAAYLIAGIAMPLSGIARIVERPVAAKWLETGAGLALAVGILAVCCWYFAIRAMTHGKPITSPKNYVGIVLSLFVLITARNVLGDSLSPEMKKYVDVVMFALPLMLAYLFWMAWKKNPAPPISV